MNQEVLKGFNRLEKKPVPILATDENLEEKNPKEEIKNMEKVIEEIKPKQEEQIVFKADDNEKIIFRVLSATYLIHIFAFAYAAYMNK